MTKPLKLKATSRGNHAMGPQGRNKCNVCIMFVCLPVYVLYWAAISMARGNMSILFTDICPVLSIAPGWHIVCAQYILLNNEWTTAHHSSCPRLGQFLQIWAVGPQLGRMERGKSWFPCSIWQQEKAEGIRDCTSEHQSQPMLSRLHVQPAYFLCLWEPEIRLGWIHSYHSAAQ